MHGIIFQQLQQYVVKNYGSASWQGLLAESGLTGKVFMPTKVYPDAEAVSIISRASEVTKVPVSSILESFGEFIAPSLMKIYSSSLKSEWSTMDMLERIENTMHKAVRFADKSADPPLLNCTRDSENQVTIHYSSPRKMIDVGVGIIKAIAKSKGETIEIKRYDAEVSTKLVINQTK